MMATKASSSWLFSDDEVRDVVKMNEKLMGIDPVSLRALIRKLANQIDMGMQCWVLRPEKDRRTPEKARSLLRVALETWVERGYATDKKDIKYAYDRLRRGDEFEKSLTYELSTPHAPFSESDLRAVQKVIFERRSIRRFSTRDVPDELIDKVLEAGIWAPCAFNMQAWRFIVIKSAEIGKLFIQPLATAAPVRIVAALDERPYKFVKDGELPSGAYIDLGLALQNMLLVAHALGLGACIGTFVGEQDTIKRELKVPDYVRLVTYFPLGWPEDEPATTPRMELEAVASREKWQGD